MHLLIAFVPAAHLDSIKQAMFDAGAGRSEKYDQCCWQILGEGQFRPLANSTPFIGTRGQLHHEPEWRLEMICSDDRLDAAIAALLAAHPYEEPAWAAWPVRSALG